MGKSYLTAQELRKQFWTMEDLTELGEGQPFDTWGLCQKESDIDFRNAGDGWLLQVPLNMLFEQSRIKYGELETEKIICFYAIELNTNNIEINFFEINLDTEVLQTYPIIPEPLPSRFGKTLN